jgi:hypothetical protein
MLAPELSTSRSVTRDCTPECLPVDRPSPTAEVELGLEVLLEEFEQHEAELRSDERIDVEALRIALGITVQVRGW